MTSLCKKCQGKTKFKKSLMLLVCFIALLCLCSKVQAVESFGELYELDEGYVTRILPQTTLQDLKNNMQTEEELIVTNKDGKALQANELVGTGMRLKIGENEYKTSVIGDLDGNGKITITDLIKIKLYQLNLLKTPEENQKSLDINKSGTAVEYYFKIDNNEWVQNEDKTKGIYTFKELERNKTYSLKMKQEMKKITEAIQVKLNDGEIKIYPSTTEWTKEDVIVKGIYPEIEEYTKQISIDNGETWQTYTEPVVISKNNSIVKARMVDEDGQEGRIKTLIVANIDKEAPNAFNITTKSTEYSIEVEGSTTDDLSGIEKYYYSKDDGETWQEENIFENLEPNTIYNIRMKAVDNVGNEYITEVNQTQTKPVYTLTIDANGGEYRGETTFVQGVGTTVTIEEPSKIGYTFAGWSKEGEGILNEGTFTLGAGDVKLTAIWEAIEYTITYVYNEGTVSTGNPSTYTIEDEITLVNPNKDGYIFKGWTGTGLNGETKTVTIAKGSTGDRTYTANWTANEYTVTYNYNGATGGNKITSQTITYGETITLPTPTKTGYQFEGWYKDINLTSGLPGTTYAPEENITLYANWEKPGTGIYAKLYTDGTLALSAHSDDTIEGKTVLKDYDKKNIKYDSYEIIYDNTTDTSGRLTVDASSVLPLWYEDKDSITQVTVINEIRALSTAYWFCDLENCTVFNDISNLNTSRVIDMNRMFSCCFDLTSINLSSFNTSSVIDMS